MPSKSFDFELGTIIKTVPPTPEEGAARRAVQDAAEREYKAAIEGGYMPAYMSPLIAQLAPWAVRKYASIPQPSGNLQDWVPRWLVYSYRAARAVGREEEARKWLHFEEENNPGVDVHAEIAQGHFEAQGLYREASE